MANPILQSGVASDQSIFDDDSTQHHRLGEKGYLDDQVFYYGRAGAVALSRGVLTTRSAVVANHVSVAWASGGTAGSHTVTVTLGATAATENQYQDGTLVSIDGTATTGQRRKIKSHPAAASAATLELTLYDPVETTFVASDELSLIANLYSGIIVHPGNASPIIVGVPQCAVAISGYSWFQTSGPGMVQGDGSTFVAGGEVVPATAATTDAGQVTIMVEIGTAANTGPVVGRVIDVGDAASDLDHRFVDFSIRA